VAFKPCTGSTLIVNHQNLHESSSSKSDTSLFSGLSSASSSSSSSSSSYESESNNCCKVMIPPTSRAESISKSNLSQSQGNLSQCSVSPLQDERWFSESPIVKLGSISSDLSSSCLQCSIKQANFKNSSDFVAQTPSPSDSGVVELEAMLREKDSEITYLRETLEQNEQVSWLYFQKKINSLVNNKLLKEKEKIDNNLL